MPQPITATSPGLACMARRTPPGAGAPGQRPAAAAMAVSARPACRPGARCPRGVRRDETGRRQTAMSKIRSVRARSGTSDGPASTDDPPGAVEQPANAPAPSSEACSSPRRLIPLWRTAHPLHATEATKTRGRPDDTEVLELSGVTKEPVPRKTASSRSPLMFRTTTILLASTLLLVGPAGAQQRLPDVPAGAVRRRPEKGGRGIPGGAQGRRCPARSRR